MKYTNNHLLKFNLFCDSITNSNINIKLDNLLNPLGFYKKGNKIYIKKENKGKFTDYCGRKVTDSCILRGKNSSDPKIRKRATFAANARTWNKIPKKSIGGLLSKILLNYLPKAVKITPKLTKPLLIRLNTKLVPKHVDLRIYEIGAIQKPISNLSPNAAYRRTDVNELKDIITTGKLRSIPDGVQVEGASRKVGRFQLGKLRGNSHGGKGFAKGEPWMGTTSSGTAPQVIVSIPGNSTSWRTGYHGSYSAPKTFDEIPLGTGLFLKFNEKGEVPISLKGAKFYGVGDDGMFYPILPY